MKLSPVPLITIAAVVGVALVMLGCEAPATTAGERNPPVYMVASAAPQPVMVAVPAAQPAAPQPAAPQPDLVTVITNAIPEVAAEDLMAAVQTNRPPVEVSERLQEVVRLAQSGVGEDVVLAFVQNSPTPFNPTPDEIVYLTDVGISDVVITALVNHRGTAQAASPAPQAVVAQPQAAPAPPVQAEATYNPEPQVVYSAPPTVQYVSPSPAVEYSYFYSSLAPYGTWVNVVDYGWCWQPTVAVIDVGWRPYWNRGRWLYSDAGWYWHSDYSWGWAPFHYGRWFHHPRRGWCWRPGDVWGPAWVSWRYTDAYCGWAPLPPGAYYRHGYGFTYYGASVGIGFSFGLHYDRWNFVPKHRFHHREVWHHGIRPHERHDVYRRSTVVNNYTVVNNTIINKGMEPDRLPGGRRGEIRKVAIRDLPDRTERRGPEIRPDRPRQEGSQTVVYRPRPQEIQRHSMSSLDARPAGTTQRPATATPSLRPGGSAAPASGGEPRPAQAGRRDEPRPSSVPSRAVAGPSPATGRPAQVAPARPQTIAPARPATTPSATSPSWSGLTSAGRTAGSETRNEPQSAPSTVTSRPQPSSSTVGSVAAPQRIPSTRPATSPASSTRAPAVVRPNVSQPSASSSASQLFQRPANVQPQAVVPPTRATRQEPAVTPNRAPAAVSSPAQIQRNSPVQGPSFSLPQQSRPAPSFSAPSVQPRSYSAPVQPRSYSPPVQSRSYSAPVQSRPTPAPSYSAPAQPRSYSAPVQSRPAPVPSRSYSAPVQSRAPQSFSIPSSRSAPSPGNSGGRRQ